MYAVLLVIHSLLRWAVILTGILAVARPISRWHHTRWSKTDSRTGLYFIIALDVQFLIGLLLYLVFSPTLSAAAMNIGAAMRDPTLRFFLVEHAIGMTGAIVLAHVGRARIRNTRDATRRHRRAVWFYGLALALLLISIPWPGMPAGRPLLPW
jgi:hypothetical protein